MEGICRACARKGMRSIYKAYGDHMQNAVKVIWRSHTYIAARDIWRSYAGRRESHVEIICRTQPKSYGDQMQNAAKVILRSHPIISHSSLAYSVQK